MPRVRAPGLLVPRTYRGTTSSVVPFGTSPRTDTLRQITVAALVRVSTLAGNQAFVSKSATGAVTQGWLLYTYNSGTLEFYRASGPSAFGQFTATGALSVDRWTWVVAVVDHDVGVTGSALYTALPGAAPRRLGSSNTLSGTIASDSAIPLGIGNYPIVSGTNGLNGGQVALAIVIPAALSQGDVAALLANPWAWRARAVLWTQPGADVDRAVAYDRSGTHAPGVVSGGTGAAGVVIPTGVRRRALTRLWVPSADVSGGTPTLTALPTSAAFSGTAGGSNPAPANVAIGNSGTGTLGTLTPSGAPAWLSAAITAGAGTNAQTLTLTPSIGVLGAGSYAGTVTLTDTSGAAIGVPVSLTLAASVSPTIGLSATRAVVNATLAGANPPVARIAVTNAGGQSLTGLAVGTITYGSGSGWIASATLDVTTAPAVLSVQCTTGALAVGAYSATFPLTSAASGVTNSPQTITVLFGVGPAVTLRALPCAAS